MTLIIGVDPGKTGAVALLDGTGGELLEVIDMPLTGKHISVHLLASHLEAVADDTSPVTCVIEDVSSSPQMGVTSAFSFGRSKGLIEGLAAGYGWRIVYITPAKWKRDMKLGKDKGQARNMAANRWPGRRDLFGRVKDDGRAEAALIALWQVQHGQ